MIYISHNMDEIFEFADRVTILKNGLRQGTEEIQDVDKLKLIKMTYSFVLSREELEQDNRELFLLKKYNENIIRNLPIGVIILDQKKQDLDRELRGGEDPGPQGRGADGPARRDAPGALRHGEGVGRSRRRSPPRRSTPGRSCTAETTGSSGCGSSPSRTTTTSTWARSS